MIKHISFDLWLTLIKSHPEFKTKRAEFFYSNFNVNNYSISEIFNRIKEIDKQCDYINEKSGDKIPAIKMYEKILVNIGIPINDIDSILLDSIKKRIDNLFLEYKPEKLTPNIDNILYILNNDGYSLNISSNTGFIESEIMLQTLFNMNLYEYFSFFLFSDEVGASKPSKFFFEQVEIKSNVNKHEILHVGDNYSTDYLGASNFGFKAMHINNNYTINDIKHRIKEVSQNF